MSVRIPAIAAARSLREQSIARRKPIDGVTPAGVIRPGWQRIGGKLTRNVMRPRASAIIAGALFASILPGAASAATARIAPAVRTASTLTSTVTLVAHHNDACRMLVDVALFDSSPGGAIGPVWEGRRTPLSACQRVYEDGSALGWVILRAPTAPLRTGRRYFVAINVWSHARAAGSRWVRHTFIRSV